MHVPKIGPKLAAPALVLHERHMNGKGAAIATPTAEP